MAERGRWNERAEAVPFPPGLPGGLRLCPFAGASHRLRLMPPGGGGMVFPLQKKQEVESEEKSEKSSFFDRDTTNLYNRGSRHGKRSHSFWRGVSIHVISVLHISFCPAAGVCGRVVAAELAGPWASGPRVSAGGVFGLFMERETWPFSPLLLESILFNFLVGKAMGALPRARKPLLVLGLLGNLGLLGYFKYANFFLDNLNWLLGTSIRGAVAAAALGDQFLYLSADCFPGGPVPRRPGRLYPAGVCLLCELFSPV